MTSDMSNPYIFKCHNCGKAKAFEGTPRAVAKFSAWLGWLNEPQPEDENGRIEYRVTCPECAEKQANHDEWAAQDDEQAEMGNGAWR